MFQNMNQNILYIWTRTIYKSCKFLRIDDFKWIEPNGLDIYMCTCNSSRGCALEVDLEYLKKLRQLHNDYNLAPDKKEMTDEMFS